MKRFFRAAISAISGAAMAFVLVLSASQAGGQPTAKVAVVNPDYYRILKHGQRGVHDSSLDPNYYSVANGSVADFGSITNLASWTGLGASPDYLTTILTSAGYQVDVYYGTSLPSITKNDYQLVIVQDPMTEVGRQFSPTVEDSEPDLLQYTTNATFLTRLDSYFKGGGSVILVGDAVRLLENGPNRLNYGKQVVAQNAGNTVTQSSPVIPQHWLFIRGNPFCGVDRSGTGTYVVQGGDLAPSGATLSSVSLFDGNDLPPCKEWSDTVYYPMDAISLLDVHVQGSGQYVLDGSTCNPPVYQDNVDYDYPNFIGYTQVSGRKLFYIGSDSFFDFQYRNYDGAWHAGQYQEINYQISADGANAILGLVQAATQAGTCTYSIPSGVSVESPSSSGSFGVTAPSGCSWSASSDASWLQTSSSGSGNGTVTYTYDANTSTSSREGHIAVGGQTFTLTQAPPASARTAVLLVHGFTGSPASFSSDGKLYHQDGTPQSSDPMDIAVLPRMGRLLEADGFLVPAPFDYSDKTSFGATDWTIEQLAGELGKTIDSITTTGNGRRVFPYHLLPGPVDQVDIVAHSMGGLIARAYIAGMGVDRANGGSNILYNGNIRKLALVGTPNYGADTRLVRDWDETAEKIIKRKLSIKNVQAKEMTFGSPFIINLHLNWLDKVLLPGLISKSDILAVAGVAAIPHLPSGDEDKDLVVNIASASLPGEFFQDYTEQIRYVRGVHWHLVEVDNSSHPTYQIVSSFLRGDSVLPTLYQPSSRIASHVLIMAQVLDASQDPPVPVRITGISIDGGKLSPGAFLYRNPDDQADTVYSLPIGDGHEHTVTIKIPKKYVQPDPITATFYGGLSSGFAQ